MTTRSLLTITFAVALAAAGTVWIKSLVPPDSPSGSLQFLSAAGELPVYDEAGAKTDLASQKGKISIIHFWATWCPPCVDEIPALSRFWETYQKRPGLSLYAISVDKDWKTVDDFMKKHPSQIPLYRDPDAAVARRFGTVQYPETYVVNEKGRVLLRVPGAVNWSDPDFRSRIDQLLAS
ncbi:MAG TPA: TlpA disulfide reductase family protein [Thermoanaerobaculia bacterium]|nr:TlpA disulfide reductase family protein [Thermoanaerobaculia bacterium]